MKNAVIYTATFAFLLSELIGLLSGLSVEQVLLRSVVLYAIIFTLGKLLVSILEKAPVDGAPAVPGTDVPTAPQGTTTDQTLAAEMPGKPAAEQDIGEQVGEAIKKAVLAKPKIVAETISSVIKNE